jgi:hypothetical protein
LTTPSRVPFFPPEITPPTFLWRDSSEAAKRWVIEISFADRSGVIRVESKGELMRQGELDPQADVTNDLLKLTAEQSGTHTWQPDSGTWEKIKKHSRKSPATITITGFTGADSKEPISAGSVTISTSNDPVGAPRFLPRRSAHALPAHRERDHPAASAICDTAHQVEGA